MKKKLEQTKKLRLRLFVSIFALAISITSLAYVTYAWLYFKRAQDLELLKVSVEEGVTYNLKYFVENDEEGYMGPDLLSGGNVVTTTSYEDDFLPVSSNFHELLLPLKHPKYRLTYALELFIEPSELDEEVDVSIISYEAPPSLYFYDIDTDEPISLASAINVYSSVVDGNLTNAQITAGAKTFIEASNPLGGDRFDGSEDIFSIAEVDAPASSTQLKKIVFFTIEFDGDPSTLYEFVSKDNGLVYYQKSTDGNSNVYQGLKFIIKMMEIRKNYVD